MAEAPDAAAKTILVPVDFSPCTDAIVDFASGFASALGRRVTLLYAWTLPPFSPVESLYISTGEDHRPLIEHVRQESAEKLERVMAGPAQAPLVAARMVVVGDPTTKIIEELRSGRHDLVILGTHGHTGLAHIALGSVAEKVLRQSPVPTLVIPCRKKQKETTP